MGSVYSNGLAYLPFLTKGQHLDIKTAMNFGVRAIFNLPRYGKQPLRALRVKLKIPSISEVTKLVITKEAWKKRKESVVSEYAGPKTRNRSNLKLPVLDKKGWSGSSLKAVLVSAWNDLPLSLKMSESPSFVKHELKKLLLCREDSH